jgi:hypothetical protein
MHKRAEWSAHIQNTGSQYNLGAPMGRMAKPQHRRGLIERFEHACGQKNIAVDLALVMLSQIEARARFPRVQEFVSYSRLGKSAREAHGKRHGTSGKTIENAHLKWAFSEAVVRLLKNNAPAQQSLAKLATQHGQGKALSILAPNRGRAVYVMLTHHVAFDQAKFLATEGWRNGLT